MKTTNILLLILSSAIAFTLSACAKSEAVGNSPAATPATKANAANTENAAKTDAKKKTDTASTPAATSDIRSVDFLNYSYPSSGCAEDLGIDKTVKVSKGQFKDGENNFYNVKDNNFMYADVNGDGKEDVVVTIECGNSGGTFRSFEIHAFTFENGKAKLMGTLDNAQVSDAYAKISNGDTYVFGIPMNGVTVDNGKLVVDVFTDGSFASPKNVTTFTYEFVGDGFVSTTKPTKRPYKP